MRILLLAIPIVGAFLFAGCYTTEDVETTDVVTAIPWGEHEEAGYSIYERDDYDFEEELGSGSLVVDRTDGQFEFQINFANEDGTDESSVLVDAETLRPEFVQRTSTVDEGFMFTGDYGAEEEDVLQIVTIEGDEEGESVLGLDEEHYYDNESSLFIWRTITFEEDYEASYYTVLTNRRDMRLLTLNVREEEEITIPSGTYDTWRVEISGEGLRQVVWFASTPDHRLVKYDNSQQVFVLTDYRDGG